MGEVLIRTRTYGCTGVPGLPLVPVILCLLFFSSQAGAEEALQRRAVHLKGAGALVHIARTAAETYMGGNPDSIITVEGGGTRRGIEGVLDGSVDIGMASSNDPGELAAVALNKDRLEEHVIGKSAVVPFVHPSNPVSDVSQDDLRKILTGEISNWKSLNGPDQPITVCSYDSASGDRAVLRSLVLQDQLITSGALVLDSFAMKTYVASHPGAFGYASLPFIDRTVKPLSVDRVRASIRTLKDKSYPLAMDLIMYARKPAAGEAKKFLDYLMSPAGQAAVRRWGDIPVAE